MVSADGDKKYSEKSFKYYQKMGINSVVKNIAENKQPQMVYRLLQLYSPDILVITGHDGMINKTHGYYNIYNYKNSIHFIESTKEAKRYERETGKNIVIFAGACQSFFEALIMSGANFASSPKRIQIDIMDPLIIAKTIATTDSSKFIKMDDIKDKLRDGEKGIGGIGAYREKNKILQQCNTIVILK